MKKQTNQQQKTHSKITKDNDSKEQIQTQDKKLLSLKGVERKTLGGKQMQENNVKPYGKKLLSLKAGILGRKPVSS